MAVRNFLSFLFLPDSLRPPLPARKRPSSLAPRGPAWALSYRTRFGLSQAERAVRISPPASASSRPAHTPKGARTPRLQGPAGAWGAGPGLLGRFASARFILVFLYRFGAVLLSLQAPRL